MEKDYSMLRPFDIEAVKRREPFGLIDSGELKLREYIAGPDARGCICIKYTNGKFYICDPDQYYMAPLCWVEGKPVYKGDVLWHDGIGRGTVVGMESDSQVALFYDSKPEWGPTGALPGNLTWTPPNVNREGWVNIVHVDYRSKSINGEFIDAVVRNADIFGTYDDAKKWAATCGDVVATLRIEWEEPAA